MSVSRKVCSGRRRSNGSDGDDFGTFGLGEDSLCRSVDSYVFISATSSLVENVPCLECAWISEMSKSSESGCPELPRTSRKSETSLILPF